MSVVSLASVHIWQRTQSVSITKNHINICLPCIVFVTPCPDVWINLCRSPSYEFWQKSVWLESSYCMRKRGKTYKNAVGQYSLCRSTRNSFWWVNYVVLCIVLCRLCCSVYCLCVNVYCTAATGCQPNCS
jgi:hypothetical protein